MKQPSSVSISLLEHCPEHIGSDRCQGSEITGNALCGGDIFPEYTHCFLQGIYVPDAQRHMRFVNYFRYLLTNFAGKKSQNQSGSSGCPQVPSRWVLGVRGLQAPRRDLREGCLLLHSGKSEQFILHHPLLPTPMKVGVNKLQSPNMGLNYYFGVGNQVKLSQASHGVPDFTDSSHPMLLSRF